MDQVLQGGVWQVQQELIVLLLLVAANTVGDVVPFLGGGVQALLNIGAAEDSRCRLGVGCRVLVDAWNDQVDEGLAVGGVLDGVSVRCPFR